MMMMPLGARCRQPLNDSSQTGRPAERARGMFSHQSGTRHLSSRGWSRPTAADAQTPVLGVKTAAPGERRTEFRGIHT
jgi:hypothetical protein